MSDITAYFNDVAERAVLSACIGDPETALGTAGDILKPDHFYRESHRAVYTTMISMQACGLSIDLVTLQDELQRRGHLEKIGGAAGLASLRTTTDDHHVAIASHARIVAERAQLRALMTAMKEVRSDIESGKPVAEVADRAERLVLEATATGTSGDRFQRVAVTPGFITGMLTQSQGYSTGWQELDSVLGKLRPGRVYLIAARPSVGKSAFAHNMALNLTKKGVPVAIATLEMERDEVIERMLAIEACVDVTGLKEDAGQCEAWDPALQRLEDAAQTINQLPLTIDEGMQFTPRALRTAARRWHREVGHGVLIIDYLQLMDGDGDAENRQQEVSAVSRALVRLARELSIPIIALSQLSRATESRSDHRPTLADLRESGSLEQDAHAVISLYRPEKYAGAVEDGRNVVGLTEIGILKNRNGRTGTVPFRFYGETCRFIPISDR